jgi:hypothetical protein
VSSAAMSLVDCILGTTCSPSAIMAGRTPMNCCCYARSRAPAACLSAFALRAADQGRAGRAKQQPRAWPV